MKKIKNYLFVFIFLLVQPSHCFEIKYCYIENISKHESNQRILQEILERELADIELNNSIDKSKHIISKISSIATSLLQKGFDVAAYQVPEMGDHSIVGFNCFSLWEGKQVCPSINLTFFVYVWPSEEFALQYHSSHPNNCLYGTTIHRHPISCAFSVLQGELVQNSYEKIEPCSCVIRKLNEKVFQIGEGEIDDLTKPFIHRLYNKASTPMSFSLHAYGLPSSEEVFSCFEKNAFDCNYDDAIILDMKKY